MISLQNISKLYDTGKLKVTALQNISLDIQTGEFIAIMGPSGSGKSTLLNLLAFLDRPSSGTYLINGKDMSSLDEDQLANFRNHTAGFIFQQFHLLHRMSARENTELPLIYGGKRYSGDCARARIEEVGLAHREKHYPNELSGGEQQRIAIARALVNDPDIIFADEPTGNLDSKSGNEILDILEKLNKEGKTIVMVTHEREVARRAGTIIHMKDGEIISRKRFKKNKVRSKTNDSGTSSVDNCLKTSHVSFARAEFSDYMRQAVSSIISHKLRSFLSMLGILIGVAAVIAMLAIGQGARESITKQLASLGSNLLIVRPGSRHQHGVALEAGRVTRFTIRDASEIQKLNEVRAVSPSVRGQVQAVHGNKNWSTQIQGVGVGYPSIRAAEPVMGRFFLQSELRSRKKVAVVGMTVVNELFGEKDPIGKTMKINRINFMVIGVLPQKGATSWRDMDDLIVMPVTTAMYRVLGREYVDYIEVDIKRPELIDRAKTTIKALVIKLHRIKEGDEGSFYIRDMTEIRDALTGTAKTMAWLLGSVAAISLIVGGIGIMNIMLVSVKERTREIGLRKAIGASRRDILLQFLIESALLSLVGGMAGLLLGSAISIGIATLAGWAVRVSLFSILLSVIFSILVGVCFGLWPAAQASRLNPIDALRYE